MHGPQSVILARHGQTPWNECGRIQGWAQVSLNETGAKQAAALAAHLAAEHPDVEAIHSSDLLRAVETVERVRRAEPFADVPVTVDRGWRERNFGVFQGFDSQEFFSRYPEYAVSELGVLAARASPELGESYVAFDRRVVDHWRHFLADLEVGKALVVTHSGVIRQIVAHLRGYDVVRAIEEIDPSNCCLTTVEIDVDGETDLGSTTVDHFLE